MLLIELFLLTNVQLKKEILLLLGFTKFDSMKIAFVSDIHEDIESLSKALKALERRNCDMLVCLGDIVGCNYDSFNFVDSRNASLCVKKIRKKANNIVTGNHDLFSIRKLPFHKADFQYPESWYELDYFQRKKLAKGKVWLYEEKELYPMLTKSDQAFIKTLEEISFIEIDNVRIALSHYIFPDPSGSLVGFFKKVDDLKHHFKHLKENHCLLSFHGHVHAKGALIANKKKIKQKAFGKYKLKRKTHSIFGPCIASGKTPNGFMIFDTKSFILEVIPLKNDKQKLS